MSSTEVRPLAPPQIQGSLGHEEMDRAQVSAVFPGGSARRGLVSVSPFCDHAHQGWRYTLPPHRPPVLFLVPRSTHTPFLYAALHSHLLPARLGSPPPRAEGRGWNPRWTGPLLGQLGARHTSNGIPVQSLQQICEVETIAVILQRRKLRPREARSHG